MSRARVLALFTFLLVVSFTGTNAGADPTTSKELVEAARAYLDPTIESVFGPRGRFVEALATWEQETGTDVLGDLDALRALVAQARGFRSDFADPRWRKENEVLEFEETGPYTNVASEEMRFTYVKPRSYPRPSKLEAIPRAAAFPLLVSFHEADDIGDPGGRSRDFPGMHVLQRRYPRDLFRPLYDDWLMLAPAADRATWVYEDGALRHAFSTAALHRFWWHLHVDFDRVVIDGRGEAAAWASVFPNVLAGVVLRGGPVDLSTVPNFAAVPVFVVEDPALERSLKEAGHPDVRSGDTDALTRWLRTRKRRVPASFDWEVASTGHVFANWVHILDTRPAGTENGEPRKPTLRVRYVDTEANPNTLRIDGRGVASVRLWLNDEVVDLDREVRVVLNGEVRDLGRLERSLGTTFEVKPGVRASMYYGWLYPVSVGPLTLPPDVPASEEPPADPPLWEPPTQAPLEAGDPGPLAADSEEPIELLSLDARLELQHAFLRGRPDTVDQWLRSVPERAARIDDDDRRLALLAEAMYPLALRDLWWRTTSDADVIRLYRRSASQATGLTARRLGWILGGGDGPYPEAAPGGEIDGWPVLTTLVLDRLRRERQGKEGLPAESPLATRPPPDAWKDWWKRYEDDYLGWWMRRAYEGDVPETLDDELLRERADTDRLAAAVRKRNLILAILTTVGLVLLTLVLGFRRGGRRVS